MKKLYAVILSLILVTGCAGFDQQRLGLPFIVPETNDLINQIPYLDDQENWGPIDYWATPKEFYARRRGDCEDYAIAKYFALKAAGFPITDMVLTVGYINNESEDGHMYLIIRHHGEFFVLDNIDPDVRPIKEAVYMEIQFTINEYSVLRAGNHPDWDVGVNILYKWNRVLRRMKQGL